MDANEVKRRVVDIEVAADDFEIAHSMEDRLHFDVLTAIANGTCDDPRECARQALKTAEIEFARYTA